MLCYVFEYVLCVIHLNYFHLAAGDEFGWVDNLRNRIWGDRFSICAEPVFFHQAAQISNFLGISDDTTNEFQIFYSKDRTINSQSIAISSKSA